MCFLPSLSVLVVSSGRWGSVESTVEAIREVEEPGDIDRVTHAEGPTGTSSTLRSPRPRRLR